MRFAWMCVLLVLVVGCVKTVDPNTGQTLVGLDPNIPAIVEPIVQAGAGLAPLFGPIGAAIGGVLVGILAAWRKIKPSLVAAKAEAEQYHAAASAVVTALEEFKGTNAEAWKEIGLYISQQLTKQGIDPKTIENVIRALRGLPPKS